MIELFEQYIRTKDRQSSKGNQLKWKKNHTWYKADFTGYEGLAEYVISNLLTESSLKQEDFVLYEPEQISYKKKIYNGVKSKDFLYDDWQIITLERLFKNYFGESFYTSIWHISNVENRLSFLVEQVERMTGFKDFGIYMSILLTIDALFLNEDRHLHNIAVLMDGQGRFRHCPLFDHGASLLSDTSMDYPLGEDVYELMRQAKAKTVSRDFDEQLDVVEALYGEHIHFSFGEKEIISFVNSATIYSEQERKRVISILCSQRKKYDYLFL